ncbi:helix-turn-helix domain-containing protein [uncultured Cellulomonas sp.]|uniref:helix-turn-helix domain-containing protein n=1 Tax=uncultured Cellulomonas sp. TaxID=189682 RepID=UPI0028EC3E5C|nr:helix-turn-helix domain-containing protein [uncultured Cellulomonas sp.]
MSNDVHAQLIAVPRRVARRKPAGERRVLNVTVQADERLLLTVAEAAARLGIGRTFMYQLLAAGEVASVHVGRLHKVPVSALKDYVERSSTRNIGQSAPRNEINS